MRALGFVERGQAWLIDALPGEDASMALASYGLGLAAEGDGFSSRFEWGMPLFSTSHTRRNDGLFYLSARGEF